ncbi:helix-turn-helix domain-containing protein [Mariniphaga sp.]|uniref:helix-turn-helix domain-containing protein n=1 Tax=Mariniphaga sp. TaxID=1954475 RepID=UPI00356643F7
MGNNGIHTKNKLEEGLLFKISPFKEVIKKTRPHKHDEYFELIFLKEGEGFHTIEEEKFVVSTPEVYFLKPGQLHFWQFTSIPKGFVIIFKDLEFDTVKENELAELYRLLSLNTRIGFPEHSFPETLLQDIYTEFQLNSSFSRPIIHGLLKALFGKLLRLAENDMQKPVVSLSLFNRFQHLLAKECPRLHKVNEFAALLNTTPQNLNTTCRKQAKKSAGELVSERILLEAKRYILHTDSTVNEIADQLSFSDASNFVKFFKKAEGTTPVQFRAKYFQ